MNRKIFQDFANTLPRMLVGWRMGEDLEKLAQLPDGTIAFDVLKGTATHSVAGPLVLYIAEEMREWLQLRLAAHDVPADALREAMVVARVQTDRIVTARRRTVVFDFSCTSRLATFDRKYEGELREQHSWHSRSAG